MLKTACHRFDPITIGLGERVCSAWMPVPGAAALRIAVDFVVLPAEEWEVRRLVLRAGRGATDERVTPPQRPGP